MKTSKKRTQQVKRKVKELLERHKIFDGPVDVELIARNEGVQVQLDDAPDDFSGMIFRRDGKDVMLINQNHHKNRQRFTIAHELGHFLMHVSDQLPLFVDESTVYFRDNRSTLAIDPKEVEANAFAAELLMPEDFMLKEFSGQRIDVSGDGKELSQIARKYGVSAQSLTIRLEKMGLLAGL